MGVLIQSVLISSKNKGHATDCDTASARELHIGVKIWETVSSYGQLLLSCNKSRKQLITHHVHLCRGGNPSNYSKTKQKHDFCYFKHIL